MTARVLDDGRVTRWAERILLPVFPRGEIRVPGGLAALTWLSTRSISLYENGHTEPSPDTLRQLALELDVSPGFLGAPDLDEIPEEAVSFRALSKMTARQRDRAL